MKLGKDCFITFNVQQRAFTGKKIFHKDLIKLAKTTNYFFYYPTKFFLMIRNKTKANFGN